MHIRLVHGLWSGSQCVPAGLQPAALRTREARLSPRSLLLHLRHGVMRGQWGSIAMPATCGQSSGPREHPGAPAIPRHCHRGETRPHRGQLRRTERLVHQYNHGEKPHSANPHPDPGGATERAGVSRSLAWAPGHTQTWPSEHLTHLDNNQKDNNRLT